VGTIVLVGVAVLVLVAVGWGVFVGVGGGGAKVEQADSIRIDINNVMDNKWFMVLRCINPPWIMKWCKSSHMIGDFLELDK
jgi:hypothetical protein